MRGTEQNRIFVASRLFNGLFSQIGCSGLGGTSLLRIIVSGGKEKNLPRWSSFLQSSTEDEFRNRSKGVS
jgi:hypothetical protein